MSIDFKKARILDADAVWQLGDWWGAPGANNPDSIVVPASLRDFKPHRKPGLKRLALFDAAANVTGSALTDDTSMTPFVGASSVRLTLSGALQYVAQTVVNSPAIDVNNSSIHVTFRTPKFSANWSDLRIQLHSAGSPAAPTGNYHQSNAYAFWVGSTYAPNVDRWSTLSMGFDDMSVVGSGANLSAITWVRIGIQGTSGDFFELGAVDVVPNARTKGAVVYTFDDAHLSQWAEVHKRFSKYGWAGVLFLDPVGQRLNQNDASYLNLTQLRQMHDAGWQVATQSYSRENNIDMSDIQWLVETQKSRMLHAALGLRGGADGSYWGSSFGFGANQPGRLRQAKKLYRTLRTFMNASGTAGVSGKMLSAGETFPFGDPYMLRCVNMNSPGGGTYPAGLNVNWQSHVQQAINNKGVAVFGAHNDFATASTQYLTELDTHLAWVKTQVDAGVLEVLTLQDLAP